MNGQGGYPSFQAGMGNFWDLDDGQQDAGEQSHSSAVALLGAIQRNERVALEDVVATKEIIEETWAAREGSVAHVEIQTIQQLLTEVFRLMAATMAQEHPGLSRSVSALVAIIKAVDSSVSSHYETVLSAWKGFLPVFLRHWEYVHAEDGQLLLDILSKYSADGLKQLEASAGALHGAPDASQELQSLTKLLVFFITRLSAILAHIGRSIDDNAADGGDACLTALTIICSYRGVLELFEKQHVTSQIKKIEELFLKAVNPSISSNSKAAGLGVEKCLSWMELLSEAEATEPPAVHGVIAFASLMLKYPSIHHHTHAHKCLHVAITACCRHAALASLHPSSTWSITDQLFLLVKTFDDANSSWAIAHQQECFAAIIVQIVQECSVHAAWSDTLPGIRLWFTLYFECRSARDQGAILQLLYAYALSDDVNDGRARAMAVLLGDLLVVADSTVAVGMARSILNIDQNTQRRHTHVVVHVLRHFPFGHFWDVSEMQTLLHALYQRAVRQSVAVQNTTSTVLYSEDICYILGLHPFAGVEKDEKTSELIFSAMAACLLSLSQELHQSTLDDACLTFMEHSVVCLMSARLHANDMMVHGLIDLTLQVLETANSTSGHPPQFLGRIFLTLLDVAYWTCKNQLSAGILQRVRDLWKNLFLLIQQVDDCVLVTRIMKILKMTAESIHSDFSSELKSFVPSDMLPVMQGYLQKRTIYHRTGASVAPISQTSAIQAALSRRKRLHSPSSFLITTLPHEPTLHNQARRATTPDGNR